MSGTEDGDPRTFAIIGAAMEVRREIGCGFQEPVYQESLAIELTRQGIPFDREVVLPVHYKGILLHATYRSVHDRLNTVAGFFQ